MTEPVIGSLAPDFTLPATGDTTVSLAKLRGNWVVLYFYPKDNTPGCTREGEDFRDLYAQFMELGAVVLGVSRDSQRVHNGFKAKYNLPFALLTDHDEAVCRAYGVFKLKTMYGKQAEGIERSTFLIDPQGVLRREWRKVKVPGHSAAVLSALRALQGS